MSWEQLKKAYDERGLVLVLGAGVSAGCGLPTWSNLLQQVFDDLEYKVCVDDLKDKLSLPAIASLIEERLGDRRVFVERIRAALYRDFPFYPEGVDKSNRRTYVRFIQEKNPTLQAVAALCARRSPDGHTYVPNPLIHAIVTFNLDGLLQAYVYARYEKRLLRTIERASAGSIPGKISTYHMHGFLRFDRYRDDLTKNAPDAVVLTEQDYFDFFNQPTSLFNYTFLYLLREFPCCFIGLSMRDDNIRRLLHYSKLERYKALQAEGEKNEDTLHRKLARHFAVLKQSGQRVLDEATEQTLRPLGVTVMWVADFAALPAQLGALYGRTDDWNAVF